MSKKAKGKVQSYPNLQSFFEKAEEFLLKKEFQNNLFWEVNRLARKKGMRRWAGNVFMQGRIALSAMITPSSYLLLSTGRQEALLRLLAYGRSKGWKIKGVTGPEESVGLFYENWKGISNSMDRSGKEFTVYSASSRHFSSDPAAPVIETVQPTSWPRIQVWAMQFARESNPPIQPNALLAVSREMMLCGNLFLLRKDGDPCGMAGFGRSTPNSLVINEVFVPREMRRRGYGAKLIAGLMVEARKRKVPNCILFSDYLGSRNLYESLGFRKVGRFSEKGFC